LKIQIDAKSGVPLYRQIIEQIKFAIARGRLR
jgi:DNA-binding transcriptional regulator YhcF (GntR family)